MRTIGIDLGGTNIQAVAVERVEPGPNDMVMTLGSPSDVDDAIESGALLACPGEKDVAYRVTGHRRVATPSAAIPEVLADRVASLVDEVGGAGAAAVGIGFAGPVDSRWGLVHVAPNLRGFGTEVPFAAMVAERCDLPVALENDVNVSVVAEDRVGAGHGARDLIGVWVGTGVGGGLVLDGELRRGPHSAAGEIGHVVVKRGGRRHPSGLRGTVEAYAGRAAIEDYARYEHGKGKETIVFDVMADMGRDHLTSSVLVEAVSRGDEFAAALVSKGRKMLAAGIASAVNLLDLDVVVLGGGVVERFGESYAADVARRLRKHLVVPEAAPDVRIALLGDYAGPVGAGLVAELSVLHRDGLVEPPVVRVPDVEEQPAAVELGDAAAGAGTGVLDVPVARVTARRALHTSAGVVPGETLAELLAVQGEPCVSLYMPTHKSGPDRDQDPLRCKNLLKRAADQLVAAGMRPPVADALLEPARLLLDDDFFWRRQDAGLALFLSSGLARGHRLPHPVDDLVVVGERFNLKPLLPALALGERFYLLTLAQNETRLWRGTARDLTPVELNGVPQSLAEALKYENPEKSLQYHTGAPRVGGARAAIFHGHGAGIDRKDDIRRWFRRVDEGVRQILPRGTAPLVLAGVDPVLPLYRDVSRYGSLVDGAIEGNPERVRPDVLHTQSLRLVEPVFAREREAATAEFARLDGTGRASADLGTVVTAAMQGRVETIFVPIGYQRWGMVDRSTSELHLHDTQGPGDRDVLDAAAIDTWLNRGKVYVVEPSAVPGGGEAAAILRF